MAPNVTDAIAGYPDCAAATPWLGEMRPFTLASASQFLPAEPTRLSTEEWAANYNITRLVGEQNSSIRTPGQTEIGVFWTEHTSQQYARTWNYLVQNYRLSLPDSARLMATLWTGAADSPIGCFNAKYTYNFWRGVALYPLRIYTQAMSKCGLTPVLTRAVFHVLIARVRQEHRGYGIK